MFILALETSGMLASAAIFHEDRCLVSGSLLDGQRTAAELTPLIARLLEQAQLAPADVEVIAVVVGPGSFTGLRVGVTTAKIFAYAVGARLVSIDTLTAYASQVSLRYERLDVILDAQRRELLVGSFASQASGMPRSLSLPRRLGEPAWRDTLTRGTLVCGPAVAKLSSLPAGVQVVNATGDRLLVETIGRLGWQRAQEGSWADVWTLTPDYFRKSAAEEKREQEDRR